MYSKSDELCDWREVGEHAREAREMGREVREEVFEGSGHCAHFVREGERYKGAVEEMWREGR